MRGVGVGQRHERGRIDRWLYRAERGSRGEPRTDPIDEQIAIWHRNRIRSNLMDPVGNHSGEVC
jgi:hypothetical protein